MSNHIWSNTISIHDFRSNQIGSDITNIESNWIQSNITNVESDQIGSDIDVIRSNRIGSDINNIWSNQIWSDIMMSDDIGSNPISVRYQIRSNRIQYRWYWIWSDQIWYLWYRIRSSVAGVGLRANIYCCAWKQCATRSLFLALGRCESERHWQWFAYARGCTRLLCRDVPLPCLSCNHR